MSAETSSLVSESTLFLETTSNLQSSISTRSFVSTTSLKSSPIKLSSTSSTNNIYSSILPSETSTFFMISRMTSESTTILETTSSNDQTSGISSTYPDFPTTTKIFSGSSTPPVDQTNFWEVTADFSFGPFPGSSTMDVPSSFPSFIYGSTNEP